MNKNLEDAGKQVGRGRLVELKTRRREVIKSFGEILKKGSEAEQKSHLLESFGSLILALDDPT